VRDFDKVAESSPSTLRLPPPERLLIVRLGALGDVLRTMPALELLPALWPNAAMYWAVEDASAPLLEGHPRLSGVLRFPRKEISALLEDPSTAGAAAARSGRFAGALRRLKADLCLDFHGTLKSGLIAALSGAPRRVGYAPPGSREGNRIFQTDLVPMPPEPMHRVERTLALLRALGAPDAPVTISLPGTAAHRERVDIWLRDNGLAATRFVVAWPGTSASQAWKRYPAGDLGRALGMIRQSTQCATVVAGGPGEESLVDEVRAASGGTATAAPVFDLLALSELLRRAALFIGPDTGPMHLAWVVGTQVLALFGSTDPRLNAPWPQVGGPHRVLYNSLSPRRGEHTDWPDPGAVAGAARDILESR